MRVISGGKPSSGGLGHDGRGRCVRPCPFRPRAGFWLSEVLVMAMLVSVVLIPVIGLFPLGRRALKQAEDLQTATFLARQTMSLTRATVVDHLTNLSLAAGNSAHHSSTTRNLNSMTFTVDEEVYSVEASPNAANPARVDVQLMDVVVRVGWPTMQRPVMLSSRVYKKYLTLQKDEMVEASAEPSPSP